MTRPTLLTAKVSIALLAVSSLVCGVRAQAPAQGVAAASTQAGSPGTAGSSGAPATPAPIVRFMAVNPGEPDGDQLALPRRIAAVVVAMDNPSPHYVVDVGSYTGEFLEAFMDRFPAAKGQWTEPVDSNRINAQRRLARFGPRINYRIGCPARDISDGCVPKDADVIITSWVSIHQPIEGIQKMYKSVYNQLPAGGWFANLEHVTFDGPWEGWLKRGRLYFDATTQGPPVHLKTPSGEPLPFPTIAEHIAALKAAGFSDPQIVWQSFTTVLLMAKK